ncbi:MAG: hypothetical protein DCC68_21230 [Planctomycetota bacterium]|nr:MAG: hypothetical protein DCC68_21230 [Planctomycetota bacterium]
MSTPPQSADAAASVRWLVYLVLIAIAVGQMLGDIFAVNSTEFARLEDEKVKAAKAETEKKLRAQGIEGEELAAKLADREADVRSRLRLQRPFLSANDRSRWNTIRALVEQGTYAIDDIQAEPGWDTIDMVKHRDKSGEYHLYSSKPPLLATLYAGPYWLIHRTTGYTLADHPYEIGRGLLVLFNVIPLVVYYVLLARLVEQYGRTDWGRIFAMAVATFGTFLNTFAVVLNNHIPAAICAVITLYAALRIWYDGRREWRYFAVAGFFGAMCVVNELPAASFFAAVAVAMLICSLRQTILAFVPAVALVAAAYFGTNYIAHDSWRPPYMHRSQTDPDDDWYRYTYDRGARKNLVSYWTDPKGIDRGERSQEVYAFNVLVGQHGIFSLTPVWLLSFAGMAMWLIRRRYPNYKLVDTPLGQVVAEELVDRRALALLVGSVSLVCIAFYILRPLEDRNYGGMTSAFRWVFWLAPLWIVTLLPAADATARSRTWRILCAILLAASALSAAYPRNPWSHPWIRNFAMYMGWSELPP